MSSDETCKTCGKPKRAPVDGEPGLARLVEAEKFCAQEGNEDCLRARLAETEARLAAATREVDRLAKRYEERIADCLDRQSRAGDDESRVRLDVQRRTWICALDMLRTLSLARTEENSNDALLPEWAREYRRRDLRAENFAHAYPVVAVSVDGERRAAVSDGRSMVLFALDAAPDADDATAKMFTAAIAQTVTAATEKRSVKRAAIVEWAGPAEGADEYLTGFTADGGGPVPVPPAQRTAILFGRFVDCNLLAHVLGAFGGESVTVATGGERDGFVLSGVDGDGKPVTAIVMPLVLPRFDESGVLGHGGTPLSQAQHATKERAARTEAAS